MLDAQRVVRHCRPHPGAAAEHADGPVTQVQAGLQPQHLGIVTQLGFLPVQVSPPHLVHELLQRRQHRRFAPCLHDLLEQLLHHQVAFHEEVVAETRVLGAKSSRIGRLRHVNDRGAGMASKGKAGGSGGHRGRSAVTGRFVKQSTVKRQPKTTINESTKKK